MSDRCAALALALMLPLAAGAQTPVRLSGYYKSLLVVSQTNLPADQDFWLDLNRLRLEVRGTLGADATFEVQYDNELLLGSYLDTFEFLARKDVSPDLYWRLESNYAERGGYYGRHRIYRGFVTLSAGDADLRFGRQRIAWGTGRFWSPLDLFNPLDPVRLEREERPGVDALLVEYKLDPVSKLAAAYAPRHDEREASLGAQWHGNAGGTDFSLIAGRFRREGVVGLDLAGQIGDAGIRAEVTHVRPEGAPAYRRLLLAVDYAFANTLTLTGEWYYDGSGAPDPSRYDFAALFAGRIGNLGRRYLGLYLGYDLTPLLTLTNHLIFNLDDHSRYFSPALTYSPGTNMELSLGVQHFHGRAGSEYGRFNDVYFTSLQWYF